MLVGDEIFFIYCLVINRFKKIILIKYIGILIRWELENMKNYC